MAETKSLLPTATSSKYYYRNISLESQQRRQQPQQNQDSGHISGDDNGSTSGSSINNRTTDGQTMMHILKANIGTGVLAMPLAFKNVGLLLGVILVPAIGAICIHCMNILIASHNRLCDRFNFESLDYDQVAGLGLACGPRWARRFAKRAHIVVTIFLMFTQIGFCCVYTLFTVENLQVAMLNLFSLNYSTTTYLIAVFPVIGLTSCTSNLKHLARISTLANCLQLFGLSLIFFDLLQFHTYSQGRHLQLPLLHANEATNSSIGGTIEGSGVLTSPGSLVVSQQTQPSTPTMLDLNRAQYRSPNIHVNHGIGPNILSGLPLFFATAVYAFEGIGVVLPLIKEMEFPGHISGLNGVLNTSMSMVAVLYMAVGFFGYAKYGHTVAGSITLNLPESTLNELVRLAFALAIGLSYSLQFYVPWTIVWPLIDESLFYSYRPREPRDKLDILQKLNKDNHWAITGQAIEEYQREQALRRQQHERQLLLQQQSQQLQRTENESDHHQQQCDEFSSTVNSNTTQHHHQQHQRMWATTEHDQESTASTLATSYTISTSCHHLLGSRSLVLGPQQRSRVFNGSGATALNQYGALDGGGAATGQQRRIAKVRNRLEDVMERDISGEHDGDADDDDDDSMPEVHWRPPPHSMRGKRKLVRYTVILLTVSFTFIAAASIPRLDLFISLIGALASSSLAIIFPAIIQLCTFWNYSEEDEHEEELARAADQATLESERERRRKLEQETRANKRNARKPIKNKWTKMRRIKWCLFVAKNCFLVVFGMVGLITGSWVSLAQLGVAGVRV